MPPTPDRGGPPNRDPNKLRRSQNLDLPTKRFCAEPIVIESQVSQYVCGYACLASSGGGCQPLGPSPRISDAGIAIESRGCVER